MILSEYIYMYINISFKYVLYDRYSTATYAETASHDLSKSRRVSNTSSEKIVSAGY
jgi:hypothetical protein